MFDSLNLSFTRGDDEEKVLENYKRVAEAIGAEAGQIVTTDDLLLRCFPSSYSRSPR